jgi:hypothetical protein
MVIDKGKNIGLTLQLVKSDGSAEESATVTYRIFDSTGTVEKVSEQSASFNATTKSYIDTLIPSVSWSGQEAGSYLVLWVVSGTDDFNGAYTEDLQILDFGEAIDFLRDIEGGRWKIDTTLNQMIFYKEDNVTEVTRFDLFDADGVPTSENVFERRRVMDGVTTTTTTTTITTTTSTSTSTETTTSTTTTTTTAPPWVFRDTFTGSDGSDPNPTYWNPNVYWEIQNNELHGAINGAQGDVISKFVLTGDFDVFVLFNDLITGTGTGNRIELLLYSPGEDLGLISARYQAGSKFLGDIKHNGSFYGGVIVSRANTYGGLRIIRIGTTLTLKYKDGPGDWTILTSNIVDADDFYVLFRITSSSGDTSGDFDDFTVWSGTIVTTTTTTTT